MNEEKQMTTEDWKAHKIQVDIIKKKRRAKFWETVKDFRRMGFTVVEVSQYQYRFNDGIDIYPSNKRFHDLTKNIRGDIRGKSFDQFLREHFGLK